MATFASLNLSVLEYMAALSAASFALSVFSFEDSFSTFIKENRNHPLILNQILDNFRQFYKYQVCYYPHYTEVPVNFAGSVAFHYQELLHEVSLEFGTKIGRIIQAPIDGLVEYHLGEAE